MYVFSLDEINFNTNGRFIPSIACEGGEAINVKGAESHHWQECKRKNAISKIKTHTSSLRSAGTDSGIYMTFMLKKKGSEEIIEKCEQLKSEHFDNYKNDRERTQIDHYHLANLGM